jgi:hypothetical protein
VVIITSGGSSIWDIRNLSSHRCLGFARRRTWTTQDVRPLEGLNRGVYMRIRGLERQIMPEKVVCCVLEHSSQAQSQYENVCLAEKDDYSSRYPTICAPVSCCQHEQSCNLLMIHHCSVVVCGTRAQRPAPWRAQTAACELYI